MYFYAHDCISKFGLNFIKVKYLKFRIMPEIKVVFPICYFLGKIDFRNIQLFLVSKTQFSLLLKPWQISKKIDHIINVLIIITLLLNVHYVIPQP